MAKNALSPMMQQYFLTKEKYKDCILFYRLGDFYEMFFDDAIKASKLLDLTLTGRDCGLEERAPMCGVPYHAVETYIAKLIECGEKVAICEQLTDPAESKGLVERDVIRVVSAGTMIEDSQLDEKKNNYIACAYQNKKKFGLAWADITTGDFYARSFVGASAEDALVDTLVRIDPAEIISNGEMFFTSEKMNVVKHQVIPKFYVFRDYAFAFNQAEKSLKEQLKVAALTAYGIADDGEIISAAGGLIEYLKETQKHSLKNINRIRVEQDESCMTLDYNAVKNLEIVTTMRDNKRYGSLLWLLDKTETGMGSRNLREWLLSPLNDLDKINYRQDGVEELFNSTLIRQGLKELLKSIVDVERITGKISNGNVMPRDCRALGESLGQIPSIIFQLSGLNSKIIKDIIKNIGEYGEITKMLLSGIEESCPAVNKDGGYIKDGFNAELDALREIKKNSTKYISDLELREREKTGIKTLRTGFNKVFGYYIEITNSFKNQVPYEYTRKQTLANAERYITDELKQLEEKILTAEEKSIKLEAELFRRIKDKLTENIKNLQRTAKSLACLDTVLALATVAKTNNYTRPVVVESGKPLEITEGRHPVVESISKEQFIPNDTYLDVAENRTMILTGPNMAGKSTYMRQTAIIVLMAHIGSFAPCKSAQIPLTDKIFTRVGASDNLIFDQSTFMVEMSEVAGILLHATEKSLLILDEVGRGTSTYDGLSIAWAVVEYITKNIKAKTLFSTHYHELTELEEIVDGVKNYKITVKELNDGIVFLRKIMRGGANKSFGVEVASLAGVPDEVTLRAKSILKQLEKNDLTKRSAVEKEKTAEPKKSEVENILYELDMNKISPMQAFNILQDLSEKAKL